MTNKPTIAILAAQLEKKDKKIGELRAQLEEALEINQELREPRIDSFYDL